MKPGTDSRHLRDHNRKHAPSRNRTFGSNATEVRVRGNAPQLLERYLALARDALAAGDRIAAENYSQHAEHYFRMINATAEGNARLRYHHPSVGTLQPQSTAAPASPQPVTDSSGKALRGIDPDRDETEPGSAPSGLI
jgi:hypothetical protein